MQKRKRSYYTYCVSYYTYCVYVPRSMSLPTPQQLTKTGFHPIDQIDPSVNPVYHPLSKQGKKDPTEASSVFPTTYPPLPPSPLRTSFFFRFAPPQQQKQLLLCSSSSRTQTRIGLILPPPPPPPPPAYAPHVRTVTHYARHVAVVSVSTPPPPPRYLTRLRRL